MKVSSSLFILLAVFCFKIGFVLTKHSALLYSGGCKLHVSHSFSITPPLLIDPKSGEFVRSSTTNGTISFNRGQQILLACPGNRNRFMTNGIYGQEVLISCIQAADFDINQKQYNIKELKCKKWPETEQRRVGKCLGNNTLAHIGFNISMGFINLIELCHDTKIHRTLYSKFVLNKESFASQRNVPRPKWLTGNLFGKVNVDKLYNRHSQIAAIGRLLGSAQHAKKYIKDTGDYFLSRGHMTAKADFFYGTQQMATFYYSNVAPQWQTSNEHNWMAIETDVRKFSRDINEDLIVYTGTHGTDTLPDINGNLVPLSLDINGHLPVPRVYWKLVHSPLQNKGIVFVGYNSPYVNSTQIQKEMLCMDICHKVKWLTWSQHNIQKGYSYCCEVNEFVARINEVPAINVQGVLN